MKKILIIAMLFTIPLISQEWGDQIELDGIQEPNMVGIDLFANNEALFLVIQDNSNDIRLYKLTSFGGIHTGYPVTISENGEFPSITGDNNTVYVTYLSNDTIKTKYSSDGNWVFMEDFESTTGNQCNGIDSKYESEVGLHIVWATADTPGAGEIRWYETYYIQYDDENNYISNAYKNVTDLMLQVGGFPTLDYSPDRVHVGYTFTFSEGPPYYSGTTTKRSRYNGNWVPEHPYIYDDTILNQVIVYDNELYCFYFNNLYTLKLKHIAFTGSSWNSTSLDIQSVYPQIFIGVAATANDRLNFAYNVGQGLLHRYYNGTSFSDPVTITTNELEEERRFGFTSVSNDLYVIFKKNNDSQLKYRQYDAAPLAPQGLAVNPYRQGNNFYAKLTWRLNNEPDVFIKATNAYSIERRIKLLDGPWSSWSVVATRGGSITEFIDSEVQGAGAERYYAEYRMRAVDYNNHYSTYSSTVMIGFSEYAPNSLVGGGLNSANKTNTSSFSDLSYNYNLSQNYPNPFNPSTQIKYSLATDAVVTVKVYDMIGTEVAKLVNETQTEGNHTYSFNAKDLSSGVYIYRITATNNGRMLFTDSKQMILLR